MRRKEEKEKKKKGEEKRKRAHDRHNLGAAAVMTFMASSITSVFSSLLGSVRLLGFGEGPADLNGKARKGQELRDSLIGKRGTAPPLFFFWFRRGLYGVLREIHSISDSFFSFVRFVACFFAFVLLLVWLPLLS
ncbi:hypothetical protein F4821DRAFT_122932 [Hypoxylon rubiginosum]|uniref:Uncharacterized protein n=1 Tax=Hypoxylon rubiginosum TaxID=110542 RepID=A0ACC0D259_9PEZI|nr:hypothetical protein F4821DRAFT_122932 [Hypoxylon rubiginosum]